MESWERWLLGVSMALLNCALSSTGFTLQRKAHLLAEEERLSDPEKTPETYSFLWGAGVVLYVLAAIPDVIAYTLVPQVVCTTVACFRLVVVTVLAHFCLKEKAQCREVIGMIVCSIGTALCLRYGPMVEAEVAEGSFYHPQIVTYLSIGLFFLAGLLLVEHADVLGCSSDKSRARQCIVLPLATGLAFGLEKVFNTEIGYVRPPDCVAAVLQQPRWIMMLLFIALLGLTDFYLNLRGAKCLPVQVFVPTSFALATALQYFQSITIFGEFKDMNQLEALLSMSGAALSLVGAIFIQPPRVTSDLCIIEETGELLVNKEEFSPVSLNEDRCGDLEANSSAVSPAEAKIRFQTHARD